jgi:multimeric flavodoxin WrbA
VLERNALRKENSMNILALQGSPRRKGNTQAVLEIALSSAQQAGAKTETIHLAGLSNLTGCMECFACQQDAEEPSCAVDDDMQSILEKAIRADVIIWSTPVFCWSPAWPLKLAMDRFYCMFRFGEANDHTCLLKDKKMAAVITAGGGEDDGADLVTDTCKRLAKFSQAEWLGALVAANVDSPDGIRTDAHLVNRVQEFGRELLR